jgi:hypothetical protein
MIIEAMNSLRRLRHLSSTPGCQSGSRREKQRSPGKLESQKKPPRTPRGAQGLDRDAGRRGGAGGTSRVHTYNAQPAFEFR